MSEDFSLMEDSNRSANPSIHEVSSPARRTVLRSGAGAGLLTLLAPLAGCAGMAAPAGAPGGTGATPTARAAASEGPRLGFQGIPTDVGDRVVVPQGYVASVIAAWG